MVHTEKGADAENIVRCLMDLGVMPAQLVLCHMDKRPDLAFHRGVARSGVMLEYDTFFRPKYQPEVSLWPLIEGMASAGLTDCLALALDMVQLEMWKSFGNSPGLPALLTDVVPRLEAMGLGESHFRGLVGGNIAHRLAGSEASSRS